MPELDKDRIYRSNGQRLARLIHLCKARFRHSQHDIVDWLGQFIPVHATIIDAGAQFGNFTKAFARLHGSTCTVHAFEPLPYNYAILKTVTAGLGNTRIHQMALSDKTGTADLLVPVKKRGRLGPGLAHFGAEQQRNYIREAVATQCLDDFVRIHAIERIDFIKCDVEGAELPAFRGAAAVLRESRPVIYTEINDDFTHRLNYNAEELFGYLLDFGYAASRVDEERPVAHPVDRYAGSGNYLFTATTIR
ncbi:MAG: FkbM family methyltransferase [Gammaproteobacteria bacterium]|nr:MAG: FkbM family methyltransferase [Gammaproteobacteria bacterium]